MAKGWVTTARGEQLNLDQLILDSKRPVNAKDEKTEIKKRVVTRLEKLENRTNNPSSKPAPQD